MLEHSNVPSPSALLTAFNLFGGFISEGTSHRQMLWLMLVLCP